MTSSLVGSEMCIRDSFFVVGPFLHWRHISKFTFDDCRCSMFVNGEYKLSTIIQLMGTTDMPMCKDRWQVQSTSSFPVHDVK
eukprot:6286377-Prorocentrum_lima.AAC.1